MKFAARIATFQNQLAIAGGFPKRLAVLVYDREGFLDHSALPAPSQVAYFTAAHSRVEQGQAKPQRSLSHMQWLKVGAREQSKPH